MNSHAIVGETEIEIAGWHNLNRSESMAVRRGSHHRISTDRAAIACDHHLAYIV